MDTVLESVRPPAVAGAFYPQSSSELRSQVCSLLASARTTHACRPKALIVPHAGYIYSGPIAASAYAGLLPFRDQISRVVLLGPAHRVHLRGLALPDATAFATPLGEIMLDGDAAAALRRLPQICVNNQAHALEHSLEVHLPFLQQILERFTLVPLAVGDASTQEVAEVLDHLWGGDETLIVVSSDLSHYRPYPEACQADEQTAREILALATNLNHTQACGATPVNGLLSVAARRGLRPQMLDLRNSGDTAGDRNRVVGYASFAFYPGGADTDGTQTADADSIDGETLIALARAAICSQFGLHFSVNGDASFLQQPGATFVTLKRAGQLRGCIGSLNAHRSLIDDVEANARAAAFRDPRFSLLRFEELSAIRIEVSLLCPPQPLAFRDEADAFSQLRPGIDGIVLEYVGHRGTFLPQVWETLPEPSSFLAALKRKAGLAADFWHADLRLSRYTVAKWAEPETM
ncbi:MAG: AmmeMemoRadiSam system protein B [Betaproteobacteria bacterium]|jgi:AmmeMemoRadiSam system protein B/AmmeMemoRadiSam system protein A